MQFNRSVTIKIATELDEYGEAKVESLKQIRVCVLYENIVNPKNAGPGDGARRKNRFDLEFIVPAKTYAPYTSLFSDNKIGVISGDKSYEVKRISKINSTSGKAKYYQISLDQVVKNGG